MRREQVRRKETGEEKGDRREGRDQKRREQVRRKGTGEQGGNR